MSEPLGAGVDLDDLATSGVYSIQATHEITRKHMQPQPDIYYGHIEITQVNGKLVRRFFPADYPEPQAPAVDMSLVRYGWSMGLQEIQVDGEYWHRWFYGEWHQGRGSLRTWTRATWLHWKNFNN